MPLLKYFAKYSRLPLLPFMCKYFCIEFEGRNCGGYQFFIFWEIFAGATAARSGWPVSGRKGRTNEQGEDAFSPIGAQLSCSSPVRRRTMRRPRLPLSSRSSQTRKRPPCGAAATSAAASAWRARR